MCKPTVTHLPVVSDGPCRFLIRSHSDACAAWSLSSSWRDKIGSVLRRWADKVEGVQSLTIVANGPAQITFNDVTDAATHGFNGATKYLNNLWRDRVFGATDMETAPILPSRTVT